MLRLALQQSEKRAEGLEIRLLELERSRNEAQTEKAVAAALREQELRYALREQERERRAMAEKMRADREQMRAEMAAALEKTEARAERKAAEEKIRALEESIKRMAAMHREKELRAAMDRQMQQLRADIETRLLHSDLEARSAPQLPPLSAESATDRRMRAFQKTIPSQIEHDQAALQPQPASEPLQPPQQQRRTQQTATQKSSNPVVTVAAQPAASPSTRPSPAVSAATPKRRQNARGSVVVKPVPLPDGAATHFFISHAQATGGDQANAIYLELERLGFAVWYDNRASDLTKDGMLKGIQDSAAFVLFLSQGVLARPYCQMEIRHAMALKKPIVLVHEADARYGGFDFRAAHAEAAPDLQELLDNHESLPFRRRGYERDGMLRTVIEHAGMRDLQESSLGGQGRQKEKMAAVPSEVGHVDLESFHQRPVQAALVELLLLPRGDERFASCVLVHGMGGTGKTVTTVAVVQEKSIRRFYSSGIYWLTVGADAVGDKIKQLQAMLHSQLTGKAVKSEDVQSKDGREWQQMLVGAIAEKERSLVVLDDPWLPEQIRLLNPIDDTETEHRLLITTRIRDLVPKATRLELPLMGKDEAVALLLDLAGVEREKYAEGSSGSSEWPPKAAYTIASECGLLPVTLTIAAQVIRSWGSGWEENVLPLLREERGPVGGSTAEARVIGAGLQSLNDQDAPAIKELFRMFAVTKEDCVHSMPVIELLWRSCCASESEKQEGELSTRLKVRQWTQRLVDQSLLLGSLTEGIHLHDIVLQYLRKQLSEEEMRAQHGKVFEGMIAVSDARRAAGGGRLQDTGSTARAFEGEEVDWYACNVGGFHAKQAMDPAVRVADDAGLQRWLLSCEDRLLVRCAATAVGQVELETLVRYLEAESRLLDAALAEWARMSTASNLYSREAREGANSVLELLKRSGSTTLPAAQLEFDARIAHGLIADKDGLQQARVAELVANYPEIRVNPLHKIQMLWPKVMLKLNMLPSHWDNGGQVTEQSMYECCEIWFCEMGDAWREVCQATIGARREVAEVGLMRQGGNVTQLLGCSQRIGDYVHKNRFEYVGADGSSVLMARALRWNFPRHFEVARSMSGITMDYFMAIPWPQDLLEHIGDVEKAITLANHQETDVLEYARRSPVPSIDLPNYFYNVVPDLVGPEAERMHDFRPLVRRVFGAFGFESASDAVEWYRTSAEWSVVRTRQFSSADGRHHFWNFDGVISCVGASMALVTPDPSTADLAFLEAVPAPESTTLHSCWFSMLRHTNPRVLVAELLERLGQHGRAIEWARAEIADEFQFNVSSKCRASRTLGRCHAALGETALSTAALDAARETARTGRLIFAEARALSSKAAAEGPDGSGAGAGAALVEVMGRMRGAREPLGRALLNVYK